MTMNNSLAEVRPELVPERSEKNLPLKPDEITFGSNKKVWWIRTKRFGGTCIRKRRKNSTRRGLILSTVLYYGGSFEVMRLFGVVT